MKVEHVAMYVNNLEGTKDFFCKYFNGKANGEYHNPKTDFKSYFISFDDGSRLEIMTRPEVEECNRKPYGLGYIHIAFSVGSKEKVDKLSEVLRSDGYKIVSGPRTTGDGYYESSIEGVEGNIIEITE